MAAFVTALAMVVQAVVVAVFLFGDIGFDHPGRYGLDFGHALLLGVVYVVALGTGIVLCLIRKWWIALPAQGVVPLVVLILFSRVSCSSGAMDPQMPWTSKPTMGGDP